MSPTITTKTKTKAQYFIVKLYFDHFQLITEENLITVKLLYSE